MGKKGNKRKTRWRVLPIGDDGSDDDEARDGERAGERGAGRGYYKPRPRSQQQSSAGTEKLTFNEDEYTRITTPRQDVLFKKGYLGRKRPAVEASASQTNGTSGQNGLSTSSTDGDRTVLSGDCVDADCGGCGDGSDLMDDPAYYYPGPFVDPMYYMNSGGYEMYDPYTGTVTVVVGPGPGGLVGLPPHLGLPPMEWFNPRLPPPPHGPPPPMQQNDFCFMHGRKRYSLDSQNCSGPSSESTGSGPPSGPPSSPQECESGGPPSGSGSGPSPGPPPLPPMGPMPYPPHPHYMYPYMFGAPLYSIDGVSVHGGPQFGPAPSSDVNAVGKRKKKKRRRRRRRGAGTDEGSEESSSEDNQLEEGASLSSQSVSSSQASVQVTPTDSDAFTDFVAKHSTLNGDASAWEPAASALLTPPETPQPQPPQQPPQQPPLSPIATSEPAPVTSSPATECCAPQQNPEENLVCAEVSEEGTSPPVVDTFNGLEEVAAVKPDIQECPKQVPPESCSRIEDTQNTEEPASLKINDAEDALSQNGPVTECAESTKDIDKNPVEEVLCISLETPTVKSIPQSCSEEILNDATELRSSENSAQESDVRSGITNPPKDKSKKAKGNNKNFENNNNNKNESNGLGGNAKGENKSVNGASNKEKRSRKNTTSTGPAPAAPAKQAEEPQPQPRTKPSDRGSEESTKQSRVPAARSKGSKKGASKTDLSLNPQVHVEQANGVMASASGSKEEEEEVSLSLRPEAPQPWGRRPVEESKPLPVEDVLLRALVGTTGLSQTETDIPVDSVDPLQKPSETQASQPVQKNRLNPSSAAQRRPKKWRQNTKERAPTPGRELSGSANSSPPSSLSSDEDETVIFSSPVASKQPPSEPPPGTESPVSGRSDAEARESPLRITEAVTAWLRTHDVEEVLVPPAGLLTPSSSDSESDAEEATEDIQHSQTGSKNEVGNPFLASSTSRLEEIRCPGDGVEERVAELTVDEAWDPLCDPALFVAKYYRLGEDPPIMAMEFRDDSTSVSPVKAKNALRWADQQDSGVHSDESGDELRDREARTVQAEELASKSAYLLRQLKGQSPFPCGGICCALQ